ncbi:MAG: N-acetylmuramoyl-L-alanine amidase [Candidatus Sumerlaeaceae bacterium]
MFRMHSTASLLISVIIVQGVPAAFGAGNAVQPSICARPCWGARAPSGTISQMSSLNRAIVHHTAGNEFNTSGYEASKANVRAIQNLHMDTNGWTDIGYHYLVDKFGYIFEGRSGAQGSLPRGAHDGTNTNSFGFNCMGYFHPTVNNVPTAAMLDSLYNVIAWRMPGGWQPYGSPGTYGPLGNSVGYVDSHRRVKATACPGDNIHNPYIGNDVNSGTIRAEIRKHMDTRNPSYYFDTGIDAFTPGNGSSALAWTNSGWPGVVYADQLGNDMFWYSPLTNYQGGGDPSINVQVFPQNGNSASHTMQLFWKTAAEDFWDGAKSSQRVSYTAQNGWISINLSMNNPKYWWQTIKQLRLDFDDTNVGARFIVNHAYLQTTPRYWFGGGTEGWVGANGVATPWWTDCCGWTGIMVVDQTGNDSHIESPRFTMLGGANDVFRVRVYPQNGSSANHDMQIFWKNSGEEFYSESKSTGVVGYSRQNDWIELIFDVGNKGGWSGNFVTQIRLDMDQYNQGVRWIFDYLIVDHF